MANYLQLSKELQEKIKNDIAEDNKPKIAFENSKAIRRDNKKDFNTIWRPSFTRDIDKIMHSAFYNRYADKTQVFSFYKNDDITRRALHVQLVSRIARNIGQVLGLNLDLIEAIALGHDLGHTPFGHAGEDFLKELYLNNTGRYFNHNVHSVRVLDGIFPYNISLQTLDGILCHNGEFELKEYRPSGLNDFQSFDAMLEQAYFDETSIKKMIPATLEGCVVRVCDMIAYIGKDRQDAFRAKLISSDAIFNQGSLGKRNAEIINNLVVNIIENSYGKDYIKLDEEYYTQLKLSKNQNYEVIYKNPEVREKYNKSIRPMFEQIYQKLFSDLKNNWKKSVVFKHHIGFVDNIRKGLNYKAPYQEEEPNQIVVDYIASMTDDYFIDLYDYLFPEGQYKVDYVSYFNDL
ncbi:deoxyguanosinetriphosphate triphosphohydrolase family protein [Anaeroselena agilis]|uniref:HD domain-containing protein n=1 Tax=Anaeroselena agilis TaxID=3063788 RepID=A0ABU3NV78_9FIRM|nr:HD domain-containing protein [Selenomonadales bacterium 4137-cl]